MKKALLLCTLLVWFLLVNTTFAGISFDCGGKNCFVAGVDAVGWLLWSGVWVITDKGIAEAVQDLIVYVLSFISLIAVIYIMYAGAQLLLNPANEEAATKTKKIITGVIWGILIIWFAWWIVSTIFYLLDDKKVAASFPTAIAETQIKNVDFDFYSNKIRALKTKIEWEYDASVMTELSILVDGAYQHLPDRDNLYENKQRYDAVKKAISAYNSKQATIDQGNVENTVRDFLERASTFTIDVDMDATPQTGDAPLSVTLEAKNAIDGSGTLIPNENFIWWIRTEGNTQKILGTWKIINYTFDMEGTYSVNLTINSVSKNSQGFNDVISFEKNVTIEVGQPQIHFMVKINDQLADKEIKIPTKEALQSIRIDASETVFASGYTIQKTEWDFGNGVTDSNEGPPQFESQKYSTGTYAIKLVLTRNDNVQFPKNIVLKIGDPLAAISVNNKTPNKWEKVVFQAQKVSKETDVTYLWEVRKSGKDTVLYSFSGTRLEYVFNDTGRYFVSLTSIKWDARDKDSMEVNIDSLPPIVEFTSEIVSSATPNMYLFDGTNSFDPDYPDNQRLRFEWFVDDAPIQLLETNEKNSRGKYIFPAKGTYRVTLRVTDADGKSQNTKKNIKINSILSLKLTLRPEVVKRGTSTLLVVTAPPWVNTYEWRIWSENPLVTKNNKLTTSSSVSGTFPVTVKVTNEEGDTNSVMGKIYVTDGDQPFAVLNIKNDSPYSAAQTSVCDNQEAIVVDRANAVSFSAEKSVNIDGKGDNLTYFWKIGLNKTSTNESLSYSFDELWCEEISLTVSDKKTGTSHTVTSWVKVINIAPRFSDIRVLPENLDMDPMRINLKMVGDKDPDGVIRSYTWYYYTDRDDQAQWFRITRVPETTFVLPKISGRYYFDVMMEDSNGLKINTKEVSETRFSTPDLYVNTNLATPIIDSFTANATEVNFWDKTRLSLTVRTALDSDVSGKSEYRWDIDWDGFYDIKTTTPTYEFQYKYPGEYNPKVKVTHSGVSATKSLTIIVKNRLIPKATVQIIWNKIVAYNMSSGIFQTVNWYIDDKKISENRDYLVIDTESSVSKKLKLEISDGKVTESVIYPIERNLKNQILLKKITWQLVVLSPASGADTTETPENIVWEDPMTPMFLYLGESRGDNIRYYAIDTDVDIDTDLNGQKNDDADNKWTASYRNGRPFQIPKGTKRVTIMRIRLIGQDNEDITSRQIRVTRSFLALPDEVDMTTKEPKTFNLSQEDKDRIDKLRNLVQIAPEEERAEFNKLLDQLGDIWYDTADRTQTLILFSLAVDASTTLPEDLKKKILEQINLIYTQWDDKMNERQAARKVIEDALSKSTYKTKIFWDGTNIGLIDQMLDNPEYYEANLAIKQTIYNDYVDPDKTLSKEVKQVIDEKLMILAGAPLSPPDETVPPPPTTSRLSLILWILWGLVCIILWGVGIAYARQRLATTHNDSEWDQLHSEDTGDHPAPQNTSDISPASSDTSATPDWLKEGGSPFGDEDVFSEKAPSSSEKHPDWLNETASSGTSSDIPVAPVEEKTFSMPDTATSQQNTTTSSLTDTPFIIETVDTPDWLNSAPWQEDVSWAEPINSMPKEEFSQDNTSSVSLEENGSSDTVPSLPDTEIMDSTLKKDWSVTSGDVSQDTTSQDEDMPDWLRGADTGTISEVISQEEKNDTSLSTDAVQEEMQSLDQVISDPSSTEDKTPIQEIFTSSPDDKSPAKKSVKKSTEKKQKTETPFLPSEAVLLDTGEKSLLEPGEDISLWEEKTPIEKTPKKKASSSTKKSLPSGENLLEPAHDMLLPSSDNHPTV